MRFDVTIHEMAVEELDAIRAFDRKKILAAIREQLMHQPAQPTRNANRSPESSRSLTTFLPFGRCEWEGTESFTTLTNRPLRSTFVRCGKSNLRKHGRHPMKAIRATELQANLDEILDQAQGGRILISRRGKPCAVLVGVESYDAEDWELAGSPEFWEMIQQRRTEGRSIPLADVEKRFGIPAQPTRRTSRPKVPRKTTRGKGAS